MPMPMALVLVGLEVWILSWVAGDNATGPHMIDCPIPAVFSLGEQ
jgi:hypothetical protein